MIKKVLWGMCGIFLISFSGRQEAVHIVHEAPSAIPSDKFVSGTIKIYKSTLRSYAKLEMLFPEGVEIEEEESAGGGFSASENSFKIIWLNLPADELVVIKYKVKAHKKASGKGKISGKFTYLEANQRKIVDVVPVEVTLGETPVITEQPKIEPRATIERHIESKGPNEYLITLNIKKEGITGYVRIAEELPSDVKITPQEIKGASFVQLENSLRFVWMAVPEDEELKVSYLISSSKEIPLEEIKGLFSFLKGEEIVNIEIPTTKFPAVLVEQKEIKYEEPTEGPKPILRKEEKIEPTPPPPPPPIAEEKPKVQEKPTVEEKSKTEEIAKKEETPQITPPPTPKKSPEVKPTPPPTTPSVEESPKAEAPKPEKTMPSKATKEPQVYYSVQICALKTMRKPASLVQKAFSFFAEKIRIDEHEGWFKYILAKKIEQYQQARDKREDIKLKYPKIPGPFVVAYSGNRRITVQEALMITGQKWVP